jgi:hypothetical protein
MHNKPLAPLPDRVKVREVNDEDLDLLKDNLRELKNLVGDHTIAFGTPIWSPSLEDEVVEHAEYIDSVQFVALHLPVIHPELAFEVFRAVCEAFDEEFQPSTSVKEYVVNMTHENSYRDLYALLEAADELDLFASIENNVSAYDEDIDLD